MTAIEHFLEVVARDQFVEGHESIGNGVASP